MASTSNVPTVELDGVVIRDPVTALAGKKSYAMFKGGREATWTPNISTSFSNSQVQFSAPPPNPQIIVDRKIKFCLPIRYEFTGDTGNVNIPLLNLGVFDAPRAFPAASVTQTLSITINNTNAALNVNDIIPGLLWYNTDQQEEDYCYSTSPCFQDQSQEYIELIGSPRNPLGAYDNTGIPHQNKRGEYPLQVLENTSTRAVIQAFYVENLFLSPLLFGEGNEAGLYGVQTMNFTFTMGDLMRSWSHCEGPIFTGTNASIVGVSSYFPQENQPMLLFHYITPNLLASIPTTNVYSYYELQRYPTEIGVVASHSNFSIQSNNIQLNSIPRRFYIYARESNATRNYLSTDTFSGIRSISVNWDNRNGLLSSATQRDLYDLSVTAGLKMTWEQFVGYAGTSYNPIIPAVIPPAVPGWPNLVSTVGSVICVEMGSTIGLVDNEAPGLLGTYQLQVRVDGYNSGPNAKSLTLYIVVVSEGVFSIGNNSASTQVGVISKTEILQAESFPEGDYTERKNLYGGNFWTNLKNFASNIRSGISKVAPYIKKAVEVGKQVAPIVAPLMGIGDQYTEEMGSGYASGMPFGYGSPYDYSGSALVSHGGYGGRMMSREHLRKRARGDWN